MPLPRFASACLTWLIRKKAPLGFEKRRGFWIDERYGGSVNLSNFGALTNGKCTGKPLIDRSSSGDSRINSTRNPVKLTIRLINHYCSADAFPYMAATVTDPPFGKIVRGQAVRLAHLDPRPCPIPPDGSKNAYESVFSYQQHETRITS